MMGDRPAPLEAMVELRQNRMIQPWPPSTTSTGSSIPSLTTPRDERQSKSIRLERSGPTASPSSSSSPRRKPGRSTNAWNQPRPKPTRGSTGWTADSETSKSTTTNKEFAAVSCPSPQPVLNSRPPPDPDPERPRNSTAISTVQRCWKYCEGRSRPSVGPRHHGHSLLTLADAIRPEPSAT